MHGFKPGIAVVDGAHPYWLSSRQALLENTGPNVGEALVSWREAEDEEGGKVLLFLEPGQMGRNQKWLGAGLGLDARSTL